MVGIKSLSQDLPGVRGITWVSKVGHKQGGKYQVGNREPLLRKNGSRFAQANNFESEWAGAIARFLGAKWRLSPAYFFPWSQITEDVAQLNATYFGKTKSLNIPEVCG